MVTPSIRVDIDHLAHAITDLCERPCRNPHWRVRMSVRWLGSDGQILCRVEHSPNGRVVKVSETDLDTDPFIFSPNLDGWTWGGALSNFEDAFFHVRRNIARSIVLPLGEGTECKIVGYY